MEDKDIPIKNYLLYKLDRTLAVLGLIALGAFAIFKGSNEALQVTIAAVGGLVGYIGGRVSK